MRHTCTPICLAVLLIAAPVLAGGGAIPFKAGVEVHMPGQRAVIAFNGKEEILLLSVDLKASEPTKVLLLVPFPSEPKASAGDDTLFDRSARSIDEKLRSAGLDEISAGDRDDDAAKKPPDKDAKPKKPKTLNVTILRTPNYRVFIARVEESLRKAGAADPVIPATLRRAAQDCLRDGFRWYAFSVIEVGPKPVATPAVQYRFATRKLYYPLRLARSNSGATAIRLILVSPRLVQMPNLRPATVQLLHQPVRIPDSELWDLGKEMHSMLPQKTPNLIRMWQIQGKLPAFQRDVMTPWH